MPNEVKFRLVSEVLRQWRQDAEERALGEYIIGICGMDREWINSRSLLEIEEKLRDVYGHVSQPNPIEEVQLQALRQADTLIEPLILEEQEQETPQSDLENESIIPPDETIKQKIERTSTKRGRPPKSLA